MSKKFLKSNKTLRHLIPGISVVLLCVVIILVSFTLTKSQDVRQQASVGNFDSLSGSNEPACQGSDCNQSNGVYDSEHGMYRLSFSPQLWKEMAIPESVDEDDQEQSYFVMRNSKAFASIYLNAVSKASVLADTSPSVQLDSSISASTSSTIELADLALALEKTIPLRKTLAQNQYSQYLGHQLLNEGYHNPVIRFDYEYHGLDQVVPYSEYVFVGDQYLVEAEVRYVATSGVAQQVETFLQNISVGDQPIVKNTGKVQGTSTVATDYDSTQIVELVKPSVVQILHLYCKEIKIHEPASVLKLSYPLCTGGTGTGFVIDEKGYIATNGHVINSYPEQDMIEGIMIGDEAVYTFLGDLIREIYFELGMQLTEDEGLFLLLEVLNDPTSSNAMILSIYDLFDEGIISIDPVKDLIYVSATNQAFSLQDVDEITQYNLESLLQNSGSVFQAKLVDMDYANMFSKSVLFEDGFAEGSDVALLKLENADYVFPAIPVYSADAVKEGDQIIVVGYPALVSGMDANPLLDSSSGGIVTVTQGIISSKKTDKSGNVLLQTDVSIEHGNSGGPALNLDGNVVGIVTYGLNSESGNYNFLRDAKDLLSLATSSDLTGLDIKDGTYKAWSDGLTYFWQKRYTMALKEFSIVEKNYSIHPIVADYVVQAETAIKAGEDIDLLFGIKKGYVYAGIGIIIFALVLILIRVLLRKRRVSAPSQQPVVAETAPQHLTTGVPQTMSAPGMQPVEEITTAATPIVPERPVTSNEMSNSVGGQPIPPQPNQNIQKEQGF